MVKLTLNEWASICNQLAQEWPLSYLLTQDAMKRNLGFTVHKHEEWILRSVDSKDVGFGTKYKTECVCLDFFNTTKETWFRLRYLNRD
jgi:hypothetical protein